MTTSHLVLLIMTNLIDGVLKMEIPTPFPVGNVNCYLIEGSPLTLIDTGPKTSDSLDTIKQELRQLQYDLSDIEQILLTHNHIDHIGLTAQFVKARFKTHNTATKVWIHQKDVDALVDYERFMDHYAASFVELIAMCGVPEKYTSMIAPKHLIEHFKSFGESVPSVCSFENTASFKTGIGEITVVWVPGHTPGSTCFVCDEKRVIFSGDHILGDISSNPSLSFDGSEKIGMLTYLESLDRISSKDSYVALPGHREPIFDMKSRIKELRTDYDDKLNKAVDALTFESQTLYDISRIIYGDYDTNSLALALAESQDIIRILEQKNQAKVINQNGVLHVVKP